MGEIILFVSGRDPAPLSALAAQSIGPANHYHVLDAVLVTGQVPDGIGLGWDMVRVVRKGPFVLPEPRDGLVLGGAIQHLNYTGAAGRKELSARSRGPLPAGADTRAVVIPIRKSKAWWDLAQDERQAHFHSHDRHVAIGLRHADRIFRTLYHCRYLGLPGGLDFVTYFEFPQQHEADFRHLLAELRDVHKNPEWAFVDLEYEIWLTKTY